ncbi:MAG: hypothetical protein H3Z53_04460 [archaeon]|nr:hypothetical protein [archaeon]MCP8313609.1 hypothetical protein [archaeon]MCP8321154.1 hypothetical protein [archaeon]
MAQKSILGRALDFLLRSTLLALVMTGVPVSALLVIWELNLAKPTFMIIWLMFALFWMFYSLLRLADKITK